MSVVQRVVGDMQVTGSFSAGSYTNMTRSSLQQGLLYIPQPLESFRIHDDYNSFLTNTPSSDDLGLIGGTFGTGVPSIQTGDVKALGATTRYCRKLIPIPAEYQAGQSVLLRLLAGMKTTVSDGTATIDVQAYRSGGDSLVDGSDLVTSAAASINDLTPDEKDFLLNPASLQPGDLIDVRIAIAINDAATVNPVIGILTNVLLGAMCKG